jgi:hypothetical protein
MFRANIIYKYLIMKEQFLNLGKALNKAEQKQIFGGRAPVCNDPEIPCYFPATHTWDCVLPNNCPL